LIFLKLVITENSKQTNVEYFSYSQKCSGIMVSLNLSHKHGDGDKALTTIEKNANIYEVIDKYRHGNHVQ
jgi:hypothetical protein